jgi:uncharacterized membrane protein YbaN (DUF454 family)
MSFNTLVQESGRDSAEAMACDAPESGFPAITPSAVASPSPRRESTEGRAERGPDAAGPWIGCSEQHGVIEIHDPRLLGPGDAAFCRALVEAAVERFGARRAEVRMESSTCRLEFEPGRFDRTELTGRVAAAVRAATPSVRTGARGQHDDGAGRRIPTGFATEGVTSPRATREASPDVPTSAERPVAAPTGSRCLADLAMAGGSFALAVGAVILPGIPTLPFLILTGRYAARVSPGIERLLIGKPWCAALLTDVEIPPGPTLDRRSLWKMIGLAILFTVGSLILQPPLPIVLGLELGLTVFLAWRELDRSAGHELGQIAA